MLTDRDGIEPDCNYWIGIESVNRKRFSKKEKTTEKQRGPKVKSQLQV